MEEQPALKRRRTNEGIPHSPERAAADANADAGPTATSSGGKGKGKAKGKRRESNPLADFDDSLSDHGNGIEEPVVAPVVPHTIDDDDVPHCAICLSPVVNKAVIRDCLHGQFCFACIRPWTDQSRRCPLCLGNIHELIHSIRSDKDFQTYHLLPLAITSGASSSAALLYAKHVASNRYTGFKPISPQQIATNANLKARIITFIRRELQVFPHVDVSFLTTYLLSIASQLDLRSAYAIRLIADFLSEDDAEHLVHEIVTFARSPFNSLEAYDRVIQYGRPARSEEPKVIANQQLLPIEEPDRYDRRQGGEPGATARPTTARQWMVLETVETKIEVEVEVEVQGPPRSSLAVPSSTLALAFATPSTALGLPTRSHPFAFSFHLAFSFLSPFPISISIPFPLPFSFALPTPSSSTPTRRLLNSPSPPSSLPSLLGRRLPPPPEPSSSSGFSIFGAAKRINNPPPPRSPTPTSKPQIEAQEEGKGLDWRDKMVSAAEARRSSDRLQHAESATPTPTSSSKALKTTDLRAQLQARLTAEYRTALANRSNNTSNTNASMSLREKLARRLEAEKALSRDYGGQGEYDGSGGEEDYWEEEEDDGGRGQPTRFSDETRQLLLARLEEEKRQWDDGGGGGGGSGEGGEERENDGFGDEKEEALRAQLARRRKPVVAEVVEKEKEKVVVEDLEARARELREKLKARLAAARK
ncbi:hypothetical protein RQP46_008369 [Phenoliferia psychrophenolica]